ncbi:amino acid-binding ACT domain protein [Corynebacterium cystitidis]|uniref:amino acid-binding ACT domain protein n=1 Tax=Corynebacterium cystitidis TaxID=35757 RepID=UPI00211EE393|nr:amino acid-binding ACT domain protein [Corynebacterium cystitidis]
MSYLIRVKLPDEPGSLGDLAQAFGMLGADIKSVDVVQTLDDDGSVLDDIVVTLPKDVMADELITAATEVEGADVDSIRPFTGRVDRRGQIKMLACVAACAHNIPAAMEELVTVMPQAMTSSWAIVLEETDKGVRRVAASQAAPADDGSSPALAHVSSARILDAEHEDWIPQPWGLLDSALAATPLAHTSMILVMGRIGGPHYLASEVSHIGDLGLIVGTLLRGT